MNDDLRLALVQIVSDFGEGIINEKNLANIVADYYSFDRNPAVRNILKTVVSGDYAVKISQLKTSKGDPNIELERYAYEIKQSWGYGADEIRYVLSCIANSIGIPFLVNNPWDKESPIADPHQNQSPIANQNSKPQINQVPNNINKSPKQQKWGQYFVIGIVIFSLLGFGAYLFFFNKSDSVIASGEIIDIKTIALKGTINDKIGFNMQLSVTGNKIEGTEHYDSQREGVNIIIKGSKEDNGTISLIEYDGGTKAGTFEGKVESGAFSGDFTNAKGKSFPFFAAVSILGKEQATSIETNVNSTNYVTKHVSFKQSSKDAETSVDIDYPIEGNKNLVEAIRKFILETLVNTYTWGDEMPKYTGDVTNGQAVVDFYGKTKMNMLKEECKREFNSERKLEESISINIIKETEKFVTYEVSFGGYHGGVSDGTTKGVTFMKKDGKQLNLFKNVNDEKLKQIVIRYVKDYFGSEADCLNESFYVNPMPQEPPTLSFNGITFDYQKYEIAPGSMGPSSITIPFDEISNFLTEEAKEVSGINTSQTKEKK